MKARVKATGEIVEVEEYSKYLECGWKYRDINTGTLYKAGSLDFSVEAVVDYWTRLEHQAAIAAMQGILSNSEYLRSLMHTKYNDYNAHEVVPNVAMRLAHALMEKYKKEER